MSKIIKREVDLANPPALSAEQAARLARLAKRPDSDIDYSDIPALDYDFWKTAVRNPLYKPTKQSTTVRVDADVLIWLKSQGRGYQTKINAILRDAMVRALEHKS